MLINLPSYGIQGAVNGDRVGSARCRDGEESCMFTFTCSHARYQFTDNAMHVPVAKCMRIIHDGKAHLIHITQHIHMHTDIGTNNTLS